MKPTPEQVAEKYETHYDPAGGPHWVTREAATGQYVAYHYIQEAADRLTTKLNALEAAEADSARLPIEALGFAFAWACTALDEGKDPREVEVPALMDAWGKAQALAARKAQP